MVTENSISVRQWSHRPKKDLELSLSRERDGVRTRLLTIMRSGQFRIIFDIHVPTTAFQTMLDAGFVVRSMGGVAIYWTHDPETGDCVINVTQPNGSDLRDPITVPRQEIIQALGLVNDRSMQPA